MSTFVKCVSCIRDTADTVYRDPISFTYTAVDKELSTPYYLNFYTMHMMLIICKNSKLIFMHHYLIVLSLIAILCGLNHAAIFNVII